MVEIFVVVMVMHLFFAGFGKVGQFSQVLALCFLPFGNGIVFVAVIGMVMHMTTWHGVSGVCSRMALPVCFYIVGRVMTSVKLSSKQLL